MRLLIINQFYVPDISPTAHLSATLAEHRAAQGDRVTVLTSYGGYVDLSKEQQAAQSQGNPRVIRVWTPKLGKKTILHRITDYACFYAVATIRAAFMHKQDVIVSLTTPPYIAWVGAIHAMIHRGAKLALWNMDCYPEIAERSGVIKERGLASRFMRAMNRALFKRLSYLINLDTAMEDLLVGSYAPKGRPLPSTIIPNFEKAEAFRADAKHEPWDKAGELGLDGRFVVLYLGNAGYGHEFDTLIEAARQLREEPITFLFIGGGSRFAELEAAKQEHGLDHLILHPYVPKESTPAVMTSVDCALITMRDHALGVISPSKLHSNLAMRLPIAYIGPEKSNVDDAIKRYDCGGSFRIGDADGVVAFIRKLQADHETHRAYRQRARHAFDDAYCDTQTMPKFDVVLNELAPTNACGVDTTATTVTG